MFFESSRKVRRLKPVVLVVPLYVGNDYYAVGNLHNYEESAVTSTETPVIHPLWSHCRYPIFIINDTATVET